MKVMKQYQKSIEVGIEFWNATSKDNLLNVKLKKDVNWKLFKYNFVGLTHHLIVVS